MMTLISVRLDPATRQTLTRMVGVTGKSRSQLVREAIQHMSARIDATEGQSPYHRMAGLIGVVDRGPGSRAAKSEAILRAMFAERRALRRSSG